MSGGNFEVMELYIGKLGMGRAASFSFSNVVEGSYLEGERLPCTVDSLELIGKNTARNMKKLGVDKYKIFHSGRVNLGDNDGYISASGVSATQVRTLIRFLDENLD